MFTIIRNLVEANKKTLKNSTGATMIEYAMVVAAIVAVAAIFFKTDGTGTIDGAITTKLNTVATAITK
jgi:Flp pilus assembly pilin Flp